MISIVFVIAEVGLTTRVNLSPESIMFSVMERAFIEQIKLLISEVAQILRVPIVYHPPDAVWLLTQIPRVCFVGHLPCLPLIIVEVMRYLIRLVQNDRPSS